MSKRRRVLAVRGVSAASAQGLEDVCADVHEYHAALEYGIPIVIDGRVVSKPTCPLGHPLSSDGVCAWCENA